MKFQDTNMSVEDFISSIEHLPSSLKMLRKSLYTEDPDLWKEWYSQVEWLVERVFMVQPKDIPGHTLRFIVAVSKIIPQWFLLQVSLRYL